MFLSFRKRVLPPAVGMMQLVSACARSNEAGQVRPKGESLAPAPIAREIAWLGDLHQPESVKYDAEQDVFFISNMVGFGSAKDANGYIVAVHAGDLSKSKVFAENGKAGVVLDAPKGMAIHGDTLWICDIDVMRAINRKTGVALAMRRTVFTALVLILSITVSVRAQSTPIRQYRAANEHRILREFLEVLAIPNLASNSEGIARNAAFISKMMEKRGISPRMLYGSDKTAPPLIYGEVLTPGAKQTIVFYAHYDGQPTDPAKWTGSEPWMPVIRTGALERGGRIVPLPAEGTQIDPEYRVYARSASDDKAGVMAFLTAIDALKASSLSPTVNIKLVFDGEEEAGSPHLGDIIRANAELLKADAWIICDGPVHQSGRKQVVYGVRGDLNVDLTVYGANRPLHSGHYGNWAPNPAFLLVRLLASMKDESGRVLIRGWYDDITPLGELEKKAIRDLPPFDDSLRRQLGFLKPEGGGRSLAQLINEPSLNINGIVSAEAGPGARNVIPTTASTTLDLRLVKSVDYQKQMQRLVQHIERQGFTVLAHAPSPEERLKYSRIATVSQRGGAYNAERTSMSLPISRSVFTAVQSAFPGRTLAIPTLGGSLPLSIIGEALHVPTITVPIANYDNNQHAEDESIRLQNLWDGIETMAALMRLQ